MGGADMYKAEKFVGWRVVRLGGTRNKVNYSKFCTRLHVFTVPEFIVALTTAWERAWETSSRTQPAPFPHSSVPWPWLDTTLCVCHPSGRSARHLGYWVALANVRAGYGGHQALHVGEHTQQYL